jgi:RNA polymerase sigma-70 factor (ECF subfamily)
MLRACLRELVAALPERARMVVTLRFQEDLAPTEIGELLDMPVSTVKSHLHRSLALMRGRLARKGLESSPRPVWRETGTVDKRRTGPVEKREAGQSGLPAVEVCL